MQDAKSPNSQPVITWFEIPSSDFERAIRFYQTLLNVELKRDEMSGIAMALFPVEDPQTGGAVVHGAPYKPSADGVCPYLYTTDLSGALNRAAKMGSQIVMPKTFLGPEIGYIALLIDSEGNRIGLHTSSDS